MKIYISCDIEGVAGIVDRLQANPEGGADFERGRRLMMAEVNAAIDGALEVAPAECVVNDAHGNMRNLIASEMHGRARLIQGRLKPLYMAEGLDASYDACFLIGYHAPAGSQFGVLNHALHPYSFRINGKPVTETTLTTAVAGHFGVPMDLYYSIQADAVSLMPGIRRPGGRTVAFEAPDIVEAYHTIMASNILSHAFDR